MLGRQLRSCASSITAARAGMKTSAVVSSFSGSLWTTSSSSSMTFRTVSVTAELKLDTFKVHVGSIHSMSHIGCRNNVGLKEFRRNFAEGGGGADLPDHFEVKLPALSPTMEMGTIVGWEKREGDQVSEGDLLCEIETDKATMGFETPEEGYLAKIILPAGSKDVPIGRLLCLITPNEEDVVKFKDYEPANDEKTVRDKKGQGNAEQDDVIPPKMAAIKAPKASPSTPKAPHSPPVTGASRPFASPSAKRLAAKKGIELSLITQGSGMDGMITAKDVEHFVPSSPTTSTVFPPTGYHHTDAELSNMRRVIAKRLQASKLEIPHYYLTIDCEMDNTLELRKRLNKEQEKNGIKLSLNDFIIKAVALACRRVPAVNSSWLDGNVIREFHTVDVSVAVDTGSGLITPIVVGAETKGLAEISSTVRDMASRAKEGKLQPHEFQGGTVTVSNLGMFGISHFTAIINSPQSCILAVGGTRLKVIPDGETTRNAQVMSVTLSCDHRVVDGAVGAQWLQHFKTFIEQPSSMLL